MQKGPIVRSRLVAHEFAGKEEREDIFAATPPSFATKVVISDAASQGYWGNGERALMIIAVKTAFLIHGTNFLGCLLWRAACLRTASLV